MQEFALYNYYGVTTQTSITMSKRGGSVERSNSLSLYDLTFIVYYLSRLIPVPQTKHCMK